MAKKAKKIVDYSKPLNNRQYEAYCQYYHACKNATQAAKDAKYSEKTADVKGCQLLSIVKVKSRLDYLDKQIADKCGITAESVVIDIVDTHRRAKDDDNYNAELKASDMLMKHTGGYKEDNEQKGLTLTDIVAIVAGQSY